MDGTLKSIFVRLNVNMQNLTNKAIAQIIIKIVFMHGDRMSKNEIKEELAKLNECKHIDDKEVEEILFELTNSELRCKDGKYYLSTPKRTAIQTSIDKSVARKEAILSKFFSGLNTDREVIKEWLQEVTIKFFEAYSEEWISDVAASTSHINHNENSIRSLITLRTNNYNGIDKEDKKILPSRFISFVTDTDTNVVDYLWEYGTSAFASKLIRTMHGVDELTLETFRNSNCILDTNILMFIALESRYKDAFVAIEKVFEDLGVKVKILYITQKEYDNKITNQRSITLHNLEKYGYDITMLPDDDFTNVAKSLRCHSVQDFERCFDVSMKRPEFIHNRLPIELLDNDKKLIETIDSAQEDEKLKNKLNSIFKSFAKHDKSGAALCHDVGLIEGVKYLRNQECEDNKYYILSEEISINQYSKEFGFKRNLPLCLRVDTLINLLAVNNGGDTFNAEDYAPLFANIIRSGLIPEANTFRQTELYRFYQMNANIAKLPKETTTDIVMTMHEEILRGVDEDDLYRDLEEMITKGELNVGKQLEVTKEELDLTSKRAKREEEKKDAVLDMLRNEILAHETRAYDKDTKSIKYRFRLWIPLILLVVIASVAAFLYFTSDEAPNIWVTIGSGIGINVASSLLIDFCFGERKINEREKNRTREIERTVNDELQKKIAKSPLYNE